MKYDKEEAFERLKIPKKLRRCILIINIPNFLCKIARKTKIVSKCSVGYCGLIFKIVVVFAGDRIEENDYTLAHEILGHKKPHKKLKFSEEEPHALEQGLLAIKFIYPKYYKKWVKKIEKYQKTGPKGIMQRIIGGTYYKNVNLKKLK